MAGSRTNCILVYEADGTFVRQWGSRGAGSGQFDLPTGVSVAPDGRIWVADSGNHRIQVFETDGTFVRSLGRYGSLDGQFSSPRGAAVGPEGRVYVADYGNQRVQVLEQDGTFVRQWGPVAEARSVTVLPGGRVFVPVSNQILVFESDGTLLRELNLVGLSEAAVAPDGRVLATEWDGHTLHVFEPTYRTFAFNGSIPSPGVVRCRQRPGYSYLDIDYLVADPDSPTVTVAVAAFEGGTNSLERFVRISTLLEGTEAQVGPNVAANTTNRISWNVGADWPADYVELKVRVMASDGRGLLDIGFITLPTNGPEPALTISASPITHDDMLPLWIWLLATNDASIHLSSGLVYGVGGAYDGALLASNTLTLPQGRAFLFDRMGLREATAGEVSRAKTGPGGVTNLWAPRITVGPNRWPGGVNEYGFDTGKWGADAWWVVKE
ncbi:MAG TPA: NHL repeat-containing protein [Kiritimatiellia bacterium]|nr:NHL repeat-containing protein [Kiritimatiellia bacterium]